MKTGNLLYITQVEKLIGLRRNSGIFNPDEMARKGYDAERVEFERQRLQEFSTATTIATLSIYHSAFASISLISQPAVWCPNVDLDMEKREVYMLVDTGRAFVFDIDSRKVKSFDTPEFDPAHEGPEFVTPSLVDLWQLTDRERERAADCLN